MKTKRESKITAELTAKETADILMAEMEKRLNADGALGKCVGGTAEDKDGLSAVVELNFVAES